MVFGHFLGCYLKYVDKTWSEVGPNGYQSDADDCRVIRSSVKEILGSKMAKINQNRPNLMNDPNFFFRKMNILNGTIHKVIMLKVKSEDIRNLVPLSRSLMIIQ